MSKSCPRCSAVNRDDAKHCKECGFGFSERSLNVRLCPAGRHPMDPSWDTCPYCVADDPQRAGTSGRRPSRGSISRDATVVEDATYRPQVAPPPPPTIERSQSPSIHSEATIAQPKSVVPIPPSLVGAKVRQGTMLGQARRIVACLVTHSWLADGQFFVVREGRNFIGSAPDCEVCIVDDQQVSSRHATIVYRNQHFWIDDEKSMNGTYLDDCPVESKTRVADRARIKVGATEFVFVAIEPQITD